MLFDILFNPGFKKIGNLLNNIQLFQIKAIILISLVNFWDLNATAIVP